MASAVSTVAPSPGENALLAKLRENTARFVEMNRALGGLFTQTQAALLLGVGTTRIGQYVQEGRLNVHDFTIEHADGQVELVGRYISGAQIERFLAVEKKPVGRPSKLRMVAAAVAVK